MSRAYFIIGTDTACGKTLVTGAMAAYARAAGRRVGVMKPFQSDCADAVFLKAMSGCEESLTTINPYYYTEPLAPAVAAERAGQQADFDVVVSQFEQIKSRHDLTLVEGAGGLLVPLIGAATHIGLLQRLQIPVLVVARLGLGTINHTLLTLEVLKMHRIPCSGVILNTTQPSLGLAEQTNPDILRRYYNVPVLGIFPYLAGAHNDAATLATAVPELVRNFIMSMAG